MTRLIHFFLILFLLISSVSFASGGKIKVIVNERVVEVPYVNKRDMVFISSKNLALSLLGNYYYNKDAAKIEMKFSRYSLKFTGRTQFIVLTPKAGGIREVIQMPLTTLMVSGDVFIPLKYAIKHVSKAYGRNLYFNSSALTISDIPSASDAPLFDFEKNKKIPAYADSDYDVSGLKVQEKANGTMITLKSRKQIGKINFSIHENFGNLFLYGVTVDPNITTGFKPAGIVKAVTNKKKNETTQLEFKIKGKYKNYEAFQDKLTGDIFITIHQPFVEEKPEDPADKEKWEFDTIVLDAGHGGKDPGAIGVTGLREKDANLGITLALGRMLEKDMPEVKVVYTRKTDKFVELHERGKIANKAEGKLFISIHCNSLGRKAPGVRGFEVYLLRPGRTKEAISIAEFENSVIQYEDNQDIYDKLNDENFILVSMAHSSYMRYSEKFSDLLNDIWQKTVPIPSRGVKQAGFYVLVGASMPGVLVEAGYLSNKADERFLRSKKGQKQVARAIFQSIKEYKIYYNSSFVKYESEN